MITTKIVDENHYKFIINSMIPGSCQTHVFFNNSISLLSSLNSNTCIEKTHNCF